MSKTNRIPLDPSCHLLFLPLFVVDGILGSSSVGCCSIAVAPASASRLPRGFLCLGTIFTADTMSYYMGTHRSSRKHQLPATVRRYPLHRAPVALPVPKPAKTASLVSSKPSTEDAPSKEGSKEKMKEKPKSDRPRGTDKEEKQNEKDKMEEKSPSESASVPEWTDWQRLEGDQFDAYWRAKAKEDSMCFLTSLFVCHPRRGQVHKLMFATDGWIYQFTRDFITIFDQDPVEPETKVASTTTAGKPVLLTQPTDAFTTSPHLPLDPPSLSTATYAVNDGDVVYASYGNAAVSALEPDLSALTLESLHSSSSLSYGQAQAQEPKSKHKRNQDHNYNHHYNDHPQDAQPPIATSSEPKAAHGVGATSKKKTGHHHNGNGRRKTAHSSHSKSRQTHRHSHDLGKIVSREKNKKFDSYSIVENWQLG